MPEVWCYFDECIYCKADRCTAEIVEINDEGVCDGYQSFLNTPEYRHKYYIAVKDINQKPAKALRQGKLIEINGVKFYTQSNPYVPEKYTNLTHERTGYAVGTVTFLRAHFDLFLKRQESAPNVDTFPLAEWDENKRAYICVKEA